MWPGAWRARVVAPFPCGFEESIVSTEQISSLLSCAKVRRSETSSRMKSCACKPLPVGNLPDLTERDTFIAGDSIAVISPEQTNPECPAAMPAAQVKNDMDCTHARPDLLFALEVGHFLGTLCTCSNPCTDCSEGGNLQGLIGVRVLHVSDLQAEWHSPRCSSETFQAPELAWAWSTRSVQRMHGNA